MESTYDNASMPKSISLNHRLAQQVFTLRYVAYFIYTAAFSPRKPYAAVVERIHQQFIYLLPNELLAAGEIPLACGCGCIGTPGTNSKFNGSASAALLLWWGLRGGKPCAPGGTDPPRFYFSV